MKKALLSLINKSGYTLIKSSLLESHIPNDIKDMDEDFFKIYEKCKEFTMTPISRMYALYKATRYILDNNIPGDFVECGVWRGGSMMLTALTLIELKDTSRKIYLYDTFEGMSKPTERDISVFGDNAQEGWVKAQKGEINEWCFASIEDVRANIASTGYPKENMIFVKGKVEETIPGTIPNSISILRIDTDWYESTKHGLSNMYPKLSLNGILILDDYGFWKGAREAVDEYFNKQNFHPMFSRIDRGCRLIVKS